MTWGGVGEDVVDRGAFLRLRDKGFDLFRGCVGVDLVAHPDTGEAVADLGICAQDSMEILVGLDGCLHRAQLNLAMLGDRGDARRQAAAQRDQHVLHRRDAVVLRGERERMVDVISERRLVMLLLAEPVESVHGRAAVGAADPGNRCTPLELGDLGGFGQRITDAE